jgi:hypothetical protein
MNLYILQGFYNTYVCIAEDILQVSELLKARYKWTENFKVSFQLDKESKFYLEWFQYSYNEYKNVKKTAEFKLIMSMPINDTEVRLVPKSSEGYI